MQEPNELLSQTNFTALDWAIVITYPLISLGIGLWVRKYIKNMTDFVCAGKGLGLCLGIATLTGTELGLITVMYNAQKGFTGGFAAFHIALAAGVVTFFVGLSGFFIYRLRKMEVLTIPEFYERRFDRKTRILGGIMMAFGGILNMGMFLYVGSLFIVGITGMSEAETFTLPLIGLELNALKIVMITLITLVLIYTCLGGMVSVVIADYVQFVVLSFGLLLASFLAIRYLGWNNIFETVAELKGAKGFDPRIAESGFGNEYIIWMCFLGLVNCAIWPTAVARALAADSPKTAKRQFMFGSISFMIRVLIPMFWGVCAYVFITKSPELKALFIPSEEAVAAGAEAANNLLGMPYFLGQILPMGVIGLITAGMIAAFMSTHDSYLLCWSSVLTQDVVAPLMEYRILTRIRTILMKWKILEPIDGPLQDPPPRFTARGRIVLTRFFIVAIGIFVVVWGLLYPLSQDVWDYMAITGAIYFSGAFALLLGGLYWKRASSTGAFLALLAGSSAILGLGTFKTWAQQGIDWLLVRVDWLLVESGERLVFEVTGAKIGLFSICLTVLAMVIGSLLFPDKPKAGDGANSMNEAAEGAK